MNLSKNLYHLFFLLLVCFIFLCAYFQIYNVDIGFHIRTGEYIFSHQRIPTVNTFSYTQPNNPWLLHQWWPPVLLYLIYVLGGLNGLVLLRCVLVLTIFIIVFINCKNQMKKYSYWPFWIVTVGILFARPRFFIRPFLFSVLFLAGLIAHLYRRQNKLRHFWFDLPLLMALWANTHAGVLYGFVYLVSYCAGEWIDWFVESPKTFRKLFKENRRLFILPIGITLSAILSLLSVWLINPNGPKVLLLPITYFTDPFWQDLIFEFHPPAGLFARLFYGFIILIILLQIRIIRQIQFKQLIPFILFTYMATHSQRAIIMFIIVTLPYLSGLLKFKNNFNLKYFNQIHRWILLPIWILIFSLLILPDRSFRFRPGLFHHYYPARMYRLMINHIPKQNFYNDMRFGGSILWFLYPKFKPFIDGRCEAYSRDFWQYIFKPVADGKENWKQIFKTYNIHGALLFFNPLDLKPRPLALNLHRDPNWALVAFNYNTLLFLERTESNKKIIAEMEFKVIWPCDLQTLSITEQNAEYAILEANKNYQFDPTGFFAKAVIARSYMLLQQFENAIFEYKTLLQSPFPKSILLKNLGECYLKTGKREEAEKNFYEMIDKGFFKGYAYYGLYLIEIEKSNLPKALIMIQRALEYEPKNPLYQNALKKIKNRIH